jgi:ATP-dependent DNA ligase
LVQPQGSWFKKLEQDSDWFAQAKLKGANTQMVLIDTDPELFNRHNAAIAHQLTEEQKDFFRSLKAYAPIVLNFELIHRQTKDWKNLCYVFDILVYRGEWLVNTTVQDRQKILTEIFSQRISTPYEFAEALAPGVWVATNFQNNWGELFSKYQSLNLFEGLILKRWSGKLEPGLREKNNEGWSIRCRKE